MMVALSPKCRNIGLLHSPSVLERAAYGRPHMSAGDFYFAVNATFRFIHDTYGKDGC